jgi:hypothetical protein
MTSGDFPRITELPELLIADSWIWERFESSIYSENFWIGLAPNNNRWLVKMRGSFYAYRERTFASLAQRLGLSCQSSVYLKLPQECLPRKGMEDTEDWQLAIWLLPEHGSQECSDHCPIEELYRNINAPAQDFVAALQASSVKNAVDWARGELLAYLCGANESSDRLFTPDHQFVLIDNEQIFSVPPGNILEAPCLEAPNNGLSQAGLKVALDLCSDFSALADDEIEEITRLPSHYTVDERWAIKPLIYEGRRAANEFLGLFG